MEHLQIMQGKREFNRFLHKLVESMPAQVRADFKAHPKIFLNSLTFFKDYIFYSYIIFCTEKVILNSNKCTIKVF